MSRAFSSMFWEDSQAARARAIPTPAPLGLCYPATAAGRWYFSTTAADQAATLSLKDARLFLDLAVTDGGLLGLADNRVALITLPPSTT